MSIATRRGDEGQTDLLFGQRVSKTSLRIEVLGTLDELNSALGLARALGLSEEATEEVDWVQRCLVAMMGELACRPEEAERYVEKGFSRIEVMDLERMDQGILKLETQQGAVTGWARPGAQGGSGAAALHLACSIARRAERCVLRLHESGEEVSELLRRALNRLSDFLWLMARFAP